MSNGPATEALAVDKVSVVEGGLQIRLPGSADDDRATLVVPVAEVGVTR